MEIKVSAAITQQMALNYPALYKGDLYLGVTKAALDGYDAVELHLSSHTEVEGEKFKNHCKNENINISAISTGLAYSNNGLSLIAPEKKIRRATIEFLKGHLKLASTLETAVIIGLIRGVYVSPMSYNEAVSLLTEALYELLEEAEKYNVRIYLEAINRFLCNYFCRISETSDYIKSFNNKLLRLHIDTHHMIIEEDDLIGSLYEAKDVLGYIHFSENNRLIPGLGSIDFINITKALKKIGYEGYIALECVPHPNIDETGPLGANYIKVISKLLNINI